MLQNTDLDLDTLSAQAGCEIKTKPLTEQERKPCTPVKAVADSSLALRPHSKPAAMSAPCLSTCCGSYRALSVDNPTLQ